MGVCMSKRDSHTFVMFNVLQLHLDKTEKKSSKDKKKCCLNQKKKEEEEEEEKMENKRKKKMGLFWEKEQVSQGEEEGGEGEQRDPGRS